MATELEEKAKPSGIVFQELGHTGLKTSGGQVVDDFLPQLRTLRERVRAYTEMKADPTIGAVLFLIEQFVRVVDWDVETPEGGSEEDAKFLRANMNGMSHTWRDFIIEAMSMLPYGFSVAEICYKMVDGKVMWKKLPFRAQDTIAEWEFDAEGGIRGFWQEAMWELGRERVFIPIEKALLFRTTSNKGNPEGVSVFRSAYKPYYYKKRIELIEAIGIERNLAGYPVLYVPDELFMDNEKARKALQTAQELVNRIRKDENMGAVMPKSWKDAGGLMLLSSEGSQTMDTERVIQRYDARIAMSVLSDVILMGHENAGSYALAEVKRNLLAHAMSAWLDIIADVLNRYAVPRLFALNGIHKPIEQLPKFIHGPVVGVDPKTMADIIFRLAGVDALRTDPKLRAYMRKILGLPVAESDELEEAQALFEAREREAIGRALSGRPDNETRPSPA